MQRSMWLRRSALVAVLAITAAACGGGDGTTDPSETEPAGSETTTEPTGSETASAEPVEITGRGDGKLTLARVLPESGFLDYLGAPMIGGVQLAIQDINEAGGVFDADVELLEYDDGTDPTVAGPNFRAALAEGADAIIGSAATGVTKAVLPTLYANDIPACTPSATGDFSTMESAQLLFRTVPPDQYVAPIIANEIIEDGNDGSVVIVQLQDPYGDFIAAEVTKALQDQGVEVALNEKYPPENPDFETIANNVEAANPTAILVVGFREASGLIKQLVETKGFDPNIMYGADGVFSSQLDDLSGVSLDGMKLIGAAGSNEFNDRLADFGVSDFLYGGQAYDCTILLALWAVASGTDDTTQWDPQVLLDLTSGGEVCTTFADCVALIDAGEDVDYDGAAGGLALSTVEGAILGQPTQSSYAVAQFQEGELVSVKSIPVDVS